MESLGAVLAYAAGCLRSLKPPGIVRFFSDNAGTMGLIMWASIPSSGMQRLAQRVCLAPPVAALASLSGDCPSRPVFVPIRAFFHDVREFVDGLMTWRWRITRRFGADWRNHDVA